MSNCVFCLIVRREAEASRVFEDAAVLAFMDNRPLTPGHVLVVPKTHATGLADLDPDTGAHMFRTAQWISLRTRRVGLVAADTDLFLADGAAAGQTVFHAHLHILPRSRGDGFGFVESRSDAKRSELDGSAAEFRRALDRE